MSAWDVAVAWIMWNVVMPTLGFLALMVVFGLLLWLVDRAAKK